MKAGQKHQECSPLVHVLEDRAVGSLVASPDKLWPGILRATTRPEFGELQMTPVYSQWRTLLLHDRRTPVGSLVAALKTSKESMSVLSPWLTVVEPWMLPVP